MLNMLAMLLVGTYAQGDAPAVDRVKYCSPHSEQDLRLHGFEIEIPRAEREPDPLAGGPNVTTVLDNGDPDNRVDLVFVGDGFTEADLANWSNLVVQGYERLFDYEPFLRYQAFFNVHQVDVISPESGVDNDPAEGVDRNTALDMGFFCANIERLLCVDVNKAEAQAAFAPDVDQIVAVANSSKYGGAGYSSSNLGTYSGFNQISVEVFIHELGHSSETSPMSTTMAGEASTRAMSSPRRMPRFSTRAR
jgi:hypothetical protein